jgi:hypothetical protein
MMIYSIKLLKKTSESDFETFFANEIMAKVDKGQRRDGKVTGLVLLKGNNTGHTSQYLWMVNGTVNGGAANKMVDKIAAFGAKVVPMIDYVEVASWHAETQAK